MNLNERKNRIIARGEHSNHSHVITGEDALVERNSKGEIIITLGSEDVVLKHLLETEWISGKETWTQEHHDINLTKLDPLTEIGGFLGRHGDVAIKKIGDKKYQYIQQKVFDPLTQRIIDAAD